MTWLRRPASPQPAAGESRAHWISMPRSVARGRTSSTRPREQLPAVQARQHDIKDDGVVVHRLRLVEPLLAVGSGIHSVAGLLQRPNQAVEQIGLVFHHKESHRRMGAGTLAGRASDR